MSLGLMYSSDLCAACSIPCSLQQCQFLAQVGKIKRLSMLSHPIKLGRQVMLRWAAFCSVRWLSQLENALR